MFPEFKMSQSEGKAIFMATLKTTFGDGTAKERNGAACDLDNLRDIFISSFGLD